MILNGNATSVYINGVREMSNFLQILFFFFVIVLGFVPGGIFISFFLLVLYYFPQILKSNENDCDEIIVNLESNATSGIEPEEMKSYSEDTLEAMK